MKKISKIFCLGVIIAVFFTSINPESVKKIYSKVCSVFSSFFDMDNLDELIDNGVEEINETAEEIKNETGLKNMDDLDVTPIPSLKDAIKQGVDEINVIFGSATPTPMPGK